jgi:hypothetical protein
MRTCHPCRLCCKIFPLPVLDKPGDEWCRHATEAGCAVHGEGQPPVCREYACFWLTEEDLPGEFRPDLVGVVVTECGTITIRGEELPVLRFNEEQPGMAVEGPARSLLAAAVENGAIALVLAGPHMDIFFDRVRYAGISSAEIEAAYRREQDGDAEELRRLGA